MSHHPIPLVPRRLLARCGGHARESGVVRSLIKLNNIISLVRERSLLRSLVHYFSWGKRACSHGHYSVFRVSPYSATPLQGCMPPHTEHHWPMDRRLSSSCTHIHLNPGIDGLAASATQHSHVFCRFTYRIAACRRRSRWYRCALRPRPRHRVCMLHNLCVIPRGSRSKGHESHALDPALG